MAVLGRRGHPGPGAVGLQSIAGPDRYGHILARAGGHEAAKDYGDLWFRERGENYDFSDWQGLGPRRRVPAGTVTPGAAALTSRNPPASTGSP
jgi:hypothetical protein